MDLASEQRLSVMPKGLDAFSLKVSGGSKHGNVYFLQGVETSRIKIGRSGTPSTRIATLRTASSEPLRLIITVFTQDMYVLEADWHQRFEHLRLHGEWFAGGADLLDAIEDLCSDARISVEPDGLKLAIDSLDKQDHASRIDGHTCARNTTQGNMTVLQVAEILGVTTNTVRRWCEPNHRGVVELQSVRTAGNHRRISHAEVDAFVARKLKQYQK